MRHLACAWRLIQCSTSKGYMRGYTYIYFGENQLSPGSFGILPLTAPHLRILQHSRVRTSSRVSSGFILDTVSSPGFGSPDIDKLAHLKLAFTAPPLQSNLGINAAIGNSPAHSSIGTTLLATGL